MKIYHLLMVGMMGIVALASAEAKAASTRDFVRNASVANEFEIDSSKLALEKSQNREVKNFAQRMIDDHTKAGDQLNTVLQSSNSGTQAATELDAKHHALMDKLQNASGDDFNRLYVRLQTDAHKQAVSLFSEYAHHGKDPALRKFAADTLPTLESHLKHVESLKL